MCPRAVRGGVAPIFDAMTDTAARKYTKATPAQVWAVLSDGYRYADWVHGTKEIRDVDADWPAEGTALHYTAGVGRVTYDGESTVKVSQSLGRLELEVDAGRAGSVHVSIVIEPSGAGSIVTLDERPLSGPVRLLLNPLSRLGFFARTKVMIVDLLQLAEAESPTVAPSDSSPREDSSD